MIKCILGYITYGELEHQKLFLEVLASSLPSSQAQYMHSTESIRVKWRRKSIYISY